MLAGVSADAAPLSPEEQLVVITNEDAAVRLENLTFYPVEVRDKEVETLESSDGSATAACVAGDATAAGGLGDVVRVSHVSRGHYIAPHVYIAVDDRQAQLRLVACVC